MKYFVKIIVITCLVFGISNSLAEEKIVYVDMNRVLTESKVGILVEKELTQIHKGNLDNFRKVEEELKKEEIDLISKRNIITAEEFNNKINALRDKSVGYQEERRKKFEGITQKRNNARTEVLKTLQPIIEEYLAKNNISLIVNSASIIVGTNKLDITKSIIDELDKKLPSIKLN